MKVRLIAESRTKTDKVDATVLAQLLPDKSRDFLPQAYLAPPQVRRARDLLRYRQALVAISSQVKCQIHALLDRLGLFHEFSDLFGKERLKFLQELKLSPIHRQALDGRLVLLATLRQLIKEAEVAARYDPALKAWHQKLRRGKGYAKATAALARKLLVVVYHILKEDKNYHTGGTKIYKLKATTLGKPVLPLVTPA